MTLSVTEMGIEGDNPNVTAVWYASTLGVFADEGVEIFTPWGWKVGMWEVLHLFSRYSQPIRIQATSDREDLVSAYASTSPDSNNLTIMLVNRSLSQTTPVQRHHRQLPRNRKPYKILRLSNLPATETFRSHTENALREDTVTIARGRDEPVPAAAIHNRRSPLELAGG